jgi:hypothetical protein
MAELNLSPLTFSVRTPLRRGVLDTTASTRPILVRAVYLQLLWRRRLHEPRTNNILLAVHVNTDSSIIEDRQNSSTKHFEWVDAILKKEGWHPYRKDSESSVRVPVIIMFRFFRLDKQFHIKLNRVNFIISNNKLHITCIVVIEIVHWTSREC